MKQKVCHFSSVHSYSDARILEKECASLAKKGYEVILVARGTKSVSIKGVKIIGVNPKKSNRFYRLFIFSYAIYKKVLDINADIYHFHDPELLIYALMLKARGKKVIFDSHEDVPEDIKNKKYLNKYFRRILAFVYAQFEKFVTKRIDAVISVSPHIVERFKKINKNSYLLTNYPIINNQIGIKKYHDRNKNIIAFAGGVSPIWMHHKIIESLTLTNNSVKYFLAGSVSNSYFEELNKKDKELKMNYLGLISRNEVAQLYSESKIGVALLDTNISFYKKGTLGNTKIFEIMYSGLPLLCSDAELWNEIINKWKCGISVSPHDKNQIAQAIDYLLDNPAKAFEMGQNGIRAVKEEYNWSVQEKTLFEIYKNINI